MDSKLLELPFAVQLSLGFGFLAYLVAFRGLRDHHKTIDTAFYTLAFGVIATAYFKGAEQFFKPLISVFVAMLAAVLLGIFWRLIVGPLGSRIGRWLNVSWGDDLPSAWLSLISDEKTVVSQVSVLTADGRRLRCDDTRPFAHLPFGPCTFGTNGDIMLYLTHVGDGDDAKAINCVDDHWGARITYVPAAQIKQVNVRRQLSDRPKAGVAEPASAVLSHPAL